MPGNQGPGHCRGPLEPPPPPGFAANSVGLANASVAPRVAANTAPNVFLFIEEFSLLICSIPTLVMRHNALPAR